MSAPFPSIRRQVQKRGFGEKRLRLEMQSLVSSGSKHRPRLFPPRSDVSSVARSAQKAFFEEGFDQHLDFPRLRHVVEVTPRLSDGEVSTS
jgi:hypothetical protein